MKRYTIADEHIASGPGLLRAGAMWRHSHDV